MKNICLLLILIIFYSCGGDDCRNDVIGTYTGNNTCPQSIPDGEFIISASPDGDSEVLIQDGISLLSGYKGDLNNKCKTITIAPQSVVNINGQGFSISGTLNINGSNIGGEMEFDSGTEPVVCSYNLDKN